MTSKANYWVVIPAAGTGSRMNVDIPKQYLKINGKTIIEHTLDCFLQRDDIKGIVVVLAADDTYWPSLTIAGHKKIIQTPGGKERYESVLNGLKVLSGIAKVNDWVLVHDAARPCLNQTDIDNMLQAVSVHSVGGLLAVPVRDTMKRTDDHNEVKETVERNNLWHALTPQMFRLQILTEALENAIRNEINITDEAMAIERFGLSPLLVAGNAKNIKVTQNDDLLLAETYLKLGR